MAGTVMERRHFLTPLRSIFDEDVRDWFVGFDRMLDEMTRKWDRAFDEATPTSHIEKQDDTHFRVMVKVPGFDREDLSVQRIDDELVVKGAHETKGKAEHKTRKASFEQHFYLAPDSRVDAAKFSDDELTIEVSFPAPKPREVQDIEVT